MGKFLRRASIAGAVGALVVSLAACGGGSNNTAGTNNGSGSGDDSNPTKGGTITLLDIPTDYEGTDPASIYYGHQIAEFRRLVYRSLVAFPSSDDPKVSGTPVADLATDTGTTKDGGKTWSFTLKDGIKWEDGKDITCQDFQYGLSRSFDDTLVNGTGPGTAYVSILDIPKAKDGTPDYKGPFQSTPQQQAAFDKAVQCDGKTITYHFSQAWPDFPLSVAALFVTDPYRKDLDKGAQNLFKVYSNGPYKIEGNSWNSDTGATFVRNDNYDASTDDPQLRQALPDSFKFELLSNVDTIYQRLIADTGDDQSAIATANIPSNFYTQIQGPIADRTLKVPSPYTRFLQINSVRVTDPKVRLALTTALDRNAAIKVLGGENYGEPASTIVSATTPGYQENAAFKDIPGDGDTAAAKKLLEEAGKVGYQIKYSYTQSDVNDKVAAIFQQSWEAAGFKVKPNPISPDANPGYYTQMSDKNKDTDVFYAGWASDWPSLLSVIPTVLETNNPGFNYGYYSNKEVDALIKSGKEAFANGDQNTMIKDLQQADEVAGKDAAYVPFLQQKNYFLFGSKIGGFLPDVAASFYPDLAGIYVKQ